MSAYWEIKKQSKLVAKMCKKFCKRMFQKGRRGGWPTGFRLNRWKGLPGRPGRLRRAAARPRRPPWVSWWLGGGARMLKSFKCNPAGALVATARRPSRTANDGPLASASTSFRPKVKPHASAASCLHRGLRNHGMCFVHL